VGTHEHEDVHAGHGWGVFSITENTVDGTQVHQSWQVCGCTLGAIRAELGPPDHELLATAEQAAAVGHAVASVDGIMRLDEPPEGDDTPTD
jgi:hypothetical protein